MLASAAPTATLRPAPDIPKIVAHIRLTIWPLYRGPVVEFHEGEEDDNVQMKLVCGVARSIAERANCAVLVAAIAGSPTRLRQTATLATRTVCAARARKAA